VIDRPGAVAGRATVRDLKPSADLYTSPDLETVVLENAYSGIRLQFLLRGALVLFVVLTVVTFPPDHDQAGCYAIAGAYALWSALLGLWTWRGGPAPVRFVWLALFVDLAALAALTLMAGISSQENWTADVLVNGFVLVPLIAALQLRPVVCAIIAGPTVAAYFLSAAATKASNNEPWGAIILGAVVLVAVGLGCIGVSVIQRARVATIGDLVRERTGLLGELTTIEARERRELAESLHDGALQYVLAARQDLEEARDLADPDAFDRLDRALSETSRLLRSTVTTLHPAVLEQAGLARALRDLASNAEATGGFTAEVDVDGWSDDLRTSADGLLYTTARELMSNVVKHADARTVRIQLARGDGVAELAIIDDGCGIADGAMENSVGRGHIGLESHRVRVEAAGGALVICPGKQAGTVAEVRVPCDC
jgi:two-component system NarL family sensor kinase